MTRSILLTIILSAVSFSLTAQYFGRNKPRYTTFDFKVKETPHFDIHHYFKNGDVINRLAQMSEQWYDYHQQIVGDSFDSRNPIIFYNNHADFQQTNTISGSIGVGTGGVTEAFKNRVVMPITFINQQTNQVLGHELVHAFQFDMVINGDSTSLQSLANLPLWLVEGMAEYMSIGRVDPFTSMWMRDAILNDKVPSVRDLYNPRYFPYRYGQAMWSYLAGYYGDGVIKPFFKTTAMYGVDHAIDSILHTDAKTLGNQWKSAMETYYEPYLRDKKENPQGKILLSSENSGRLNVSPSISPNGRYVVFLSEKDLFTTDLFLADAKSGKILNKVASLVKDGDLDNLNIMESAGTWSPDNRQFAFVAFKKGQNTLVIKEALSGKTLENLSLPGIPSFASPAWSPDGKKILFSGLVQGHPDLYLYTLKTGKVEQLTDDRYSEIQASFNKDGTQIIFSYDKRSVEEGRTFGKYTFDLATMDLSTRAISTLDVFHGADNLNPTFDFEGNVYFVSDRDGFRNLYKYEINTGDVFQKTDLLTGISGISRYSPMIAVASDRDRVLYTHYFDNSYSIYQASGDDFLNIEVDPTTIDLTAGTLPITGLNKLNIVNKNLNNSDDYVAMNENDFRTKRYSPKFKLDYIGGGAGVGVSTSNTLGNYTGLQGGIDMMFGDMLGNNQIFAQLAVNGEIYDFGGSVSYINRKNRLAWGFGVSHIPLRTGYTSYSSDTLFVSGTNQAVPVIKTSTNLLRVFEEGLTGFVHFPFSTTLRLEGSLTGSYRSFRYDIYNDYYAGNQFEGYRLVLSDKEKIAVGDEINFNSFYTLRSGTGASANIALVGDNSFFGLTSPLAGYRYRLSLDKNIGADDYLTFLADYRKYFWLKPVSISVRGMSYLRYENRENSVYPFYVGQMGFVRGYGSIFSNDLETELDLDFGQLLGSKMGLASLEVRLPFTGPKQLALIGSSYFLSDLSIFFDAGVAFDSFDQFSDGTLYNVAQRNSEGQILIDPNTGAPIYSFENRKPAIAMSAGVSMRINLFGALILEPYFAWPLRSGGTRTFGLNFIPGW